MPMTAPDARPHAPRSALAGLLLAGLLALLLLGSCGQPQGERSKGGSSVNQVGAKLPSDPGGGSTPATGVVAKPTDELPELFQAPPDESARPVPGARVELFYGTNRARVEYGWGYLLEPLGMPAALLGLAVASLLVRRRRPKPRTGSVRRGVQGLLVLGLLGYGLWGLQRFEQRRQAAELLPVNYSTERSAPGLHAFELGTCTVSIPPTHRTGVVELPSLLRLELRLDPARHFFLETIEPLEDEPFYAALEERLAAAESRSLFAFVHGFNNSFQEAAFRTAQIHHDLGFGGVPVFFSWPSLSSVAGYTADENNVGDAVGDLERFLDGLLRRADTERIHLVAHSMGSRALTRAVKTLGLKYQGAPIFDELVLAAPDIDAGELEQLVAYLEPATERITLYASSDDPAMTVSRNFHGGTYPRAGESVPTPVVIPGVDSIDVTRVTSGHSYISDNGRILSDLAGILQRRRPLDETIAERVEAALGQIYWVLEQAP